MSKKILIIDDESNILLSLSYVTRKAGYHVKTASDGEEALEEIKRWQPDLILLDIGLPSMDGFEICQTLRDDTRWDQLRIIMLTARGREVEKEKGLALGADAYITKPFSVDSLMEKISSLLG
jgi:DNA-binding response OmpR family regulator